MRCVMRCAMRCVIEISGSPEISTHYTTHYTQLVTHDHEQHACYTLHYVSCLRVGAKTLRKIARAIFTRVLHCVMENTNNSVLHNELSLCSFAVDG